MKRKKQRRINKRTLKELISTASSKRLLSLSKRLNASKATKSLVQDELVARDLQRGGPDKNWGHG